MKDEIKEILEIFKKINEEYSVDTELDFEDYEIPNIYLKQFLDYITNLQQELEIRQQDINNLTYQLAKEKSKIDKAIDLLKEAGCYDEETKTFCDDVYEELPELLNILNGGDDNE